MPDSLIPITTSAHAVAPQSVLIMVAGIDHLKNGPISLAPKIRRLKHYKIEYLLHTNHAAMKTAFLDVTCEEWYK
jgi:hypothetical protein